MGNNSLKQLSNNLTNNDFLQCLTMSLFLGSLTNRLRDLNIKCSRHYSAMQSKTEPKGSRTILHKQESFLVFPGLNILNSLIHEPL